MRSLRFTLFLAVVTVVASVLISTPAPALGNSACGWTNNAFNIYADLVKSTTERMAVFDCNGRRLVYVEGNRTSVGKGIEAVTMDNVVIHNHPAGESGVPTFSLDDVAWLVDHNPVLSIVVGHNDATNQWSVCTFDRNGNQGWPDTRDYWSDFTATGYDGNGMERVGHSLERSAVERKGGTYYTNLIAVYDEFWKQYAADHNLLYHCEAYQ